MRRDRNQRVIPRFTQEWHDDQWVCLHFKDIEAFEKYFKRKRQFDTSEEVRELWRTYEKLKGMIAEIYLDQNS